MTEPPHPPTSSLPPAPRSIRGYAARQERRVARQTEPAPGVTAQHTRTRRRRRPRHEHRSEDGPGHDSLRTVPLTASGVADWPPPPRPHDTTAHGQARRWGTGTMMDAFDDIHVCIVALEGSGAGQLPETVTRPWLTLCERIARLDRGQPIPASILNTRNLTELARWALIHLSRDRRTRDIPYEARRQRR